MLRQINACRKYLAGTAKARNELEEIITKSKDLQKKIAVLEASNDFKAEEELNDLIKSNEKQGIAVTKADKLNEEIASNLIEIGRLEKAIAKCKTAIDLAEGSADFIPLEKYAEMRKRIDKNDRDIQVAISSTFYEQLVFTKVLFAAFLGLQLVFIFFFGKMELAKVLLIKCC